MTLALYLTRVVGLRVAAAGLGMLVLAISLDLLREARTLAALGGLSAIPHYALLRLPALAPSVLPLAVLIGATSGFLALSVRSELTVMRSAGWSVFGLLARLIPLALVLGAAQALVTDRGVAWSERALAAHFGETVVGVSTPEAGHRIAVRLSRDVVVGQLGHPDGTVLTDVTIFPVSGDGRIERRVDAERAVYDAHGWHLEGVRRDGAQITEPRAPWPTALRPSDVTDIAAGPRSVTAAEALRALAGRNAATHGEDFLAVQVQRVGASVATPA